MIRGVTPVDAALELMGMHEAQALIRSVFMGTMAGKLIFALGFILSFRMGLAQGHFRPVMVFTMIFFALWFLAVLPQAKGVVPVSVMERAGYKTLTTQDILRKNGYEVLVINPVFDTLSRMVDALVTAMAAVLERGRAKQGYLKQPFLGVKLSLVTNRILASGIKDPGLEEDLVHFYQDHFWPAVRKSRGHVSNTQDEFGTCSRNIWPGHADVVAAYKEEGRTQWQALRERLFAACDTDHVFSRLFEVFYDGKADKDAVVRSLLEQELKLKPGRYTVFMYRNYGDTYQIQRMNLAHVPEIILAFLPFIHGGALFLLWVSLPAWLGAALIFRPVDLLARFLLALVAVKSWTLIWAVLDKSSWVWFTVSKMRGAAWAWENPVPGMLVALAALVLPVAMTGWCVHRGGCRARP